MIMLSVIGYIAVSLSLSFFNPHNPGFGQVDKLYTLHVVVIWLTPNEWVQSKRPPKTVIYSSLDNKLLEGRAGRPTV